MTDIIFDEENTRYISSSKITPKGRVQRFFRKKEKGLFSHDLLERNFDDLVANKPPYFALITDDEGQRVLINTKLLNRAQCRASDQPKHWLLGWHEFHGSNYLEMSGESFNAQMAAQGFQLETPHAPTQMAAQGLTYKAPQLG